MTKDYLELAELMAQVKESMEDAFPERIWVKAEIASWAPRANGHCYLSLTQSKGGKVLAECKAMIWKWFYPQLKAYFEQTTGQSLQAGITVLVRVRLNFSEVYGVSLFIEDIDPAFTLGEQALERKRAIEKLTVEGYMDMQKELALPRLPGRLAVISSRTAAGYGDFCRHLTENEAGYAFQLDLYEALMQGEQAPASIIAAIAQASEKGYDALLILRGGGSEMDLACFDDYDLAVAIATCPLPVVTAIGHDRDFHIADMVASQYVKTPTALADLFIDAYAAEDAAIDSVRDRIRGGLTQQLQRAEMDLQRAQARIGKALQGRVSALELPLLDRVHRLRFAASARISEAVSAVALREAVIRSSDPRNILSLGYVLVSGKDNKLLKSVERVRIGDRIGVRFSDGSLTARVEQVYGNQMDNEKTQIA